MYAITEATEYFDIFIMINCIIIINVIIINGIIIIIINGRLKIL